MSKPEIEDFDQLYPGPYLKAGELLGQAVTLTIADVSLEELIDDQAGQPNEDGDKVKLKGIITFKETPKKLVLNKTNGLCLKAMFGRKPRRDWIGREVTLYPGEWRGEPAIRIKGSPELQKTVTVTIRLPQKKPVQVRLEPTKRRGLLAPKEPEASTATKTESEAAS